MSAENEEGLKISELTPAAFADVESAGYVPVAIGEETVKVPAADFKGAKGDKGDAGATGPQGLAGQNGVNGQDGADGKSAYEVAVDNGFEGTEAQWLTSLKGDKGDKGDAGATSVDVIKWSEVFAAEDKEVFEERIQADLAAGVEPVVLDDADPTPRIATLSGKNIYVDGQQIERFSVFRTAANERNFTNYIPGKGISEVSYLDSQLKNGVAAYDPDTALVSAPNNRNLTYTYTGTNTLNFVVSPTDGMAANFAVKITSTAQTDGTVAVYKKANGLYVPLMPSVAGGNTVEAGKTYQLTCVGDCWTLAEFEESTESSWAEIGGRMYKAVKIGGLYWMAENLDYAWDGLNFPANSISTTEPDANYYNGSLTGSYGLLYSGTARDYMISHASELGFGAWRVPSSNDFIDLMDAVGLETSGTKLRSTSVWSDGGGTDDYGFNAYPTGAMHGEGALMGQPSYTYDEEKTRTGFWTSDNSGDYYVRFGLQSGGAVAALGNQNKFNGHNVRLCMDA